MTPALIAALLPLVTQAGVPLIKDVINLIHGNPQQQGEADDAYVARLAAMDKAIAAQIKAEDQDIQS